MRWENILEGNNLRKGWSLGREVKNGMQHSSGWGKKLEKKSKKGMVEIEMPGLEQIKSGFHPTPGVSPSELITGWIGLYN